MKIYVALLDEGVECWRLVDAIRKHGDIYTILVDNPDPEDEHWEFSHGDDVICRSHRCSDATIGLKALHLADY